MGYSTRKERDKMALRLAEDFLAGEDEARSHDEVLAGVRFALGGPCPPWWAEHRYEVLAIRREDAEDRIL